MPKINHERLNPKKSQKNKDRKPTGLGGLIEESNRIKEPYKHKNSGRGTLLMPSFMKWVASQDIYKGLERHHYFTGGGRMDCFISCVSPKMHSDIHFGSMGVQGFIDYRGERILICESMDMLQCYLDDPLTCVKEVRKYQLLIDAVLGDVNGAVDVVKKFNV